MLNITLTSLSQASAKVGFGSPWKAGGGLLQNSVSLPGHESWVQVHVRGVVGLYCQGLQ